MGIRALAHAAAMRRNALLEEADLPLDELRCRLVHRARWETRASDCR